MDKKKLMLLMGALVVAVGTALAARSMLAGGSTAPVVNAAIVPPQPQGPKVLVAQRALPVGTIITPDAVTFQPWPKDMVQDAYFLDGEVDKNKLIGTVVRFQITAGQPLTQGALVAPGDRGFLAAALGPGMRAISIPVSDMTGVSGFIFPGDHVDLMLTQSVKGAGGGDEGLKATETILRNVRILATDQATESETVNGKTVVKKNNNVTLEVTPRIAEKIQVAQTLGTLSLALRSIADNQSELEKAIASGSIKVPEGASKQTEDKLLAQALNKPIEGNTTFATGGDVSRFARRGLSAAPAAPAAGAGGPPIYAGPSVRVIRGSDAANVPVGMGAAASGFVNSTANGAGNAGRMMGPAMVAGAGA
ncbi:MAG: Flp pilus assembly protein CpaB [Sphingomonadales bacterium]|nr:Flp pilus assembly protein CpaB [Sphingomonadales bacterium]